MHAACENRRPRETHSPVTLDMPAKTLGSNDLILCIGKDSIPAQLDGLQSGLRVSTPSLETENEQSEHAAICTQTSSGLVHARPEF